MGWMQVKLPVTEMERYKALQQEFEKAFTALDGLRHTAMFCSKNPDDHFDFYFSPEASRLIPVTLMSFDATPSPAPMRDDVSLLVGTADAWDLLNDQSP
jgi:hypothetical protein